MFRIVSRRQFNDTLFMLELEIPAIAQNAGAGQHVDIHLNPDAPPLTLPLVGFDADAGTITVLEHARDLTSERLMMLTEGDEVFQIRGPLGSACRIDCDSKVVLIGEDLGVASLLPRARAYRDKGVYVICIVGYENRDAVYLQDEFTDVSNELLVVTADGSFGISGKPTAPLRAMLETHKDVEQIVHIGALKNMKRTAKVAADAGVAARVCFDALRPATGQPGIFETAPDAQEAFAFAKAADLDAADVDFDKLIAREKALAKQAEEPAPNS